MKMLFIDFVSIGIPFVWFSQPLPNFGFKVVHVAQPSLNPLVKTKVVGQGFDGWLAQPLPNLVFKVGHLGCFVSIGTPLWGVLCP